MIATALCLCLSSAPSDNDQLVGLWAGAYSEPTELVSIDVRFEQSEAELVALVSLPERGFRLNAAVECEGERVSWTVVTDQGKIRARFRGQLEGAQLRGRLDGYAIAGDVALNLLRVVELDQELRERYAGTYRLDAETTLQIVRVPRALDEVLGLEFPAEGIRSLLFALSSTELVAGKGEQPLPIATRLDFRLDDQGGVQQLELQLGDTALMATPVTAKSPPERAPRLELAAGLDVERRAVRIDAGDIELAGTLYLPPGVKRPCPAVVQLHGSAPTRHVDQWFYFTSTCLRSGLAVLAYDKRGCGASTGRFRSFTVASSSKLFDQLASDGAAAHAWLRKQEGIDPERVGLVGGSQAGWIMPLVAEKTAGVRFILSACGPTLSAGEEAFHEEQVDNGVELAQADRRLEEYDGPLGYDPRALLRRNKTPILWMFGERDDVIPTQACLAELEKLRSEGHLQHDGHIFLDADHSFRTTLGDSVLLEPVIIHWLEGIGVLR